MENITKTNSNNERIIALDIIRIVAISLVVWVHCQEQINYGGLLSHFTYLLGRTGVPLFLMISGALIFSKEIIIKNFFKKSLELYIIAVFWFYIYGTLHLSVLNNVYSSFMLIPSAKHLWYLAMLPFLYFILPFLYDIKNISTRNLLFLTLGCFVYKWLIIFWNFGYNICDYFIYIAYVIFGYIAYNRELYKKISMPAAITSILSAIIAFLLIHPQEFYQNLFKGYDIWWYYSPFIVIFSLLSYIILLKLRATYIPTCLHTFIRLLAESCFGVYVIHYYVLLKLDYFAHNTCQLFVLTLLVSFIVVNLLAKIPIIKFLLGKK